MAKYHMMREYQGPPGAHLNSLTHYSLYHEVKMEGTMHPGRKRFGKAYNPHISLKMDIKEGRSVPITKSRNPGRKGKLAKASARLNARLVSFHGIKDDPSYRCPGSMKC